jgi:hypothetical protein
LLSGVNRGCAGDEEEDLKREKDGIQEGQDCHH